MTKEQIVQVYLMNSPKVVAEMLYETIERYENRRCESCKYYCPQEYNITEEVLDQWIHCKQIYAETVGLVNFKNFSCNTWESK